MQVKHVVGILASVALVAGCHQAKAPPQASAQDIEAAQQEAQREIADARREAAKDVKSAAKTMGADSKGVSQAKAIGSYDVAMVAADGDHKIATEKCLTLQPAQQKPCSDQADANYEAAKAAAKDTRVARQQ
jgi:uncharacterized protein YbjQ (UPF0145 family)